MPCRHRRGQGIPANHDNHAQRISLPGQMVITTSLRFRRRREPGGRPESLQHLGTAPCIRPWTSRWPGCCGIPSEHFTRFHTCAGMHASHCLHGSAMTFQSGHDAARTANHCCLGLHYRPYSWTNDSRSQVLRILPDCVHDRTFPIMFFTPSGILRSDKTLIAN